jgi:hypothetical protein
MHRERTWDLSFTRAQSGVALALPQILQQVLDQSGYIGALVMAAPDPSMGGEIKTITYELVCLVGFPRSYTFSLQSV